MKTARIFLGISLLALLVQSSFGRPAKGARHSDQDKIFDPPKAQPQYTSYGEHSEPVHYSAHPASVPHTYPVFVQAPSTPQFVQVAPSGSSFPSAGPVMAYPMASGPVQSGYPALYSASAPGLPLAAEGPGQATLASSVQAVGPAMGSSVVPVLVVQGGAAGPGQQGAPQAQMPETQWAVRPSTFSEEEAPVALSLSEVLPPAPLPPTGPVLQSGETSNIVKEAELGNYQQQTEEFGYPADPVQPRVAFSSVVPVAAPGLGGFPWWGSPYPGFDYSLLYGLYPPGTYTTFSQNHERGKDYHQSIHYLKEHVSEEQGPHQQQQTQQKVLRSGPQVQQFQ